MRVRKGTRSLRNGKVMVKSSATKGARQLRCPKCKSLAGPSQDGQGRVVYKCACGRTFGSVRF